ncbi:MAG: 30S ribosomal protein S18 [Pyrinomonadaceae bacterium]
MRNDSYSDRRDNRNDGGSNGDDDRDKRPQRRFYRRRQKPTVPTYVDWKDTEFLERFIPERGKILPRRISGVTAKDQRRIARAIKRARVMALLPYVAD